jgi:hypothetical protein
MCLIVILVSYQPFKLNLWFGCSGFWTYAAGHVCKAYVSGFMYIPYSIKHIIMPPMHAHVSVHDKDANLILCQLTAMWAWVGVCPVLLSC